MATAMMQPSRHAARLGATGLAVLCLFLAATPARADNAIGTIKVGCVEFPPLSFTNPHGAADGSAIALIAAILDQAGLAWEAKCLPGARLMASLRDGSAHVAMLIRHPDIAGAALYSQSPMAYLDLDGYRMAGTPPLADMDSLRGKRVILLRGYGYGGWSEFFKDPRNAMQISFADSHQAAFRMLASGHGDYLLDYREPAMRALGDAVPPGLQHELLARLECYFLVSKKAPDAEALLRRIEDGFQRMGAKPLN